MLLRGLYGCYCRVAIELVNLIRRGRLLSFFRDVQTLDADTIDAPRIVRWFPPFRLQVEKVDCSTQQTVIKHWKMSPSVMARVIQLPLEQR